MRNSNDHAKPNDKSFGARAATALKSAAQRGKRLIETISGTSASNVALAYGGALVAIPVCNALALGLATMLGMSGLAVYHAGAVMFTGAVAFGSLTTGFLANGIICASADRSIRAASKAASAGVGSSVSTAKAGAAGPAVRAAHQAVQSVPPRSAMHSISPSVATSAPRPTTAQPKSDRPSL